MNQQPWKFVIIRDREQLSKLAEINVNARYVDKVAFAVAIYVEESRIGEIDTIRVIIHMQLAAWLLETHLGSCFNWGWDATKVVTHIDSLEDAQLVTIIPFGYLRNSNIQGKKSQQSWEEIVVEQ